MNMKCYKCHEFGRIAKHFKNRKIKQNRSATDQEPGDKPQHKVTTNEKKETQWVWVEKDKIKEIKLDCLDCPTQRKKKYVGS